MSDTRGHGEPARRGLRIMLLSLAAVIVLLGAAAAGAYGYAALSHGASAGAVRT